MLKISTIPKTFSLRNSWHDKIENNFKIKNLPYNYTISKSFDNNKNPLWLSIDTEKQKTSIAISETALKYLSGIEVPDSNIGMYFCDYLPTENNYLILNNKGHITPVRFLLSISKIIIDDVEYPFVDIILKNLILEEEYLIPLKQKESWKFIIYSDDIEKAIKHILTDNTLDEKAKIVSTYMSNTEKMYQDTFIHKIIVKYVCEKFAKHLEEEGLTEDANELRQRGICHDNSKILNKTEFVSLTGIIDDKSCLRDANQALSSYKQDAIELHWKNNSHHPEHYECPNQMSRMDRIEFVCDCYARSIQYGTDLIEFMKTRQELRFHFPEIMFDEIMCNCKIIMTL